MAPSGNRARRKRRPLTRKQRLRRFVIILEVGCCACVLAVFVYALYHYTIDSPYYKVEQILVYGAEEVTEREVQEAAGVTIDDNLFLVSRATVAKNVAGLPYVETAEVTRETPGTLIITIEERTAVATVLAGRRAYLVDKNGYVLREQASKTPVTGPLITSVPDLGIPTPGAHLDSETLREALALWSAYSQAPVSQSVTLSEIAAEGPMQLVMFWEEAPYEVRWGRSEYRMQAERLSALWENKGGQLPCQEYLDLRFDEDLVCR
jgi:cell division septal protein FtsQ